MPTIDALTSDRCASAPTCLRPHERRPHRCTPRSPLVSGRTPGPTPPRHASPRPPGTRGRLALRRKVRRSLGWVLVKVGLKLAVDRGTGT